MSRRPTDVLIIGAGPTGLVLALWLTRLGVTVRIVDKTAEPGTTSRALGVQARTLEFYSQVGLADDVVARGRKSTSVNLWVAGKHCARVPFGDFGVDVSPFPFVLIYPQDEHERLLIDRLSRLGVSVERHTELVGFEDTPTGARAHLKRADGTTEECFVEWLAGCDGARSTVREKLQIGFPGATYDHLFYVADVNAAGPAMNGEVHAGLDETDFLAVFPLRDEGRARLVGTVRDTSREQLAWTDVSKRVIDWMHLDVAQVNWFSTYRVHHRVAEHFRKGNVFLLGDAAHIHSPVGGQGMNTGIGDAVNLAWKIAAVLHRRADPSILDTYEPERIAFARRLVATTDRIFSAVTSRGAIARRLRLNIAPFLIPFLFRFAIVRRFMFRIVSQTVVNYRGSSLSKKHAGGDRLPWLSLEDNYRPLTSLDWQVHVYGEAAADLRAVCSQRNLPLHVFPWRSEMKQSGLRRNAIYLLRPDGYVSLAEREGNAEAVARWVDTVIKFHRESR